MIPFGAQIAIGIIGGAIANGINVGANMMMTNGLQQGMYEAQVRKQNNNNGNHQHSNNHQHNNNNNNNNKH